MEEEALNQTKDLLSDISKSLSSSESVTVSAALLPQGVIEFTISLPREDAGRVIGKYGDVIKSLRSVFYAVTMHKLKKRSNIIVEPF